MRVMRLFDMRLSGFDCTLYSGPFHKVHGSAERFFDFERKVRENMIRTVSFDFIRSQ